MMPCLGAPFFAEGSPEGLLGALRLIAEINPRRAGAGFGGADAEVRPAEIAVDQLITDATKVSIGGTDFVLYPTTGGETSDAPMVYLLARGVLFTRDLMMPYLGAPPFPPAPP